jgi:hypothetical protein
MHIFYLRKDIEIKCAEYILKRIDLVNLAVQIIIYIKI